MLRFTKTEGVDMRTKFEEYSEQERAIITDLARRDYADMTKDEVMLFAEWEATKAYIESDLEAKRKALEDETKAKIEIARQTEQKALDTLEAMAQAAKERLKAVEDGQA